MPESSEKSPSLPPRWFTRSFWAVQRAAYSVTGGRFGLRTATADRWGMMRLRTVGRRTGKQLSYPLDALGCHAAGSGQARLAAQLLGAAATVRAGAGNRVMPFLAPRVAQAEASAIAALGASRFEAEFTARSRLSREAAVRLALGEPGSILNKLGVNSRAQVTAWMAGAPGPAAAGRPTIRRARS